MDEETNESYSGKFQFHVIELKKLGQTKGKAKKQSLYRWAKLIAANTWEEIEIESEGNRYMERAKDIIKKIAPIYKAIKNNPNATKEEIYDQISEN